MTGLLIVLYALNIALAWWLGARKGYARWGLFCGLFPVFGPIRVAMAGKSHERKVEEARERLAVEEEARKTR